MTESSARLGTFSSYLPEIQALNLSDTQRARIAVHSDPTSDQAFLFLGEIPPGAPPVGSSRFGEAGVRQLYVYENEVPEQLWSQLSLTLASKRRSGTGGTGMFGNDAERVVDEDNPRRNWKSLEVGEEPAADAENTPGG